MKRDIAAINSTGYLRYNYLDDLDLDGDLDLITNGISWFENSDGNFDYAPEKNIDSNEPDPDNVITMDFQDMDGDGDKDIVYFAYIDQNVGQIKWIEHLDGHGEFGASRILIESFPGFSRALLIVEDVDFDNDFDVVLHNGPNDIVWFKNNGNNNFSEQIFISEYGDVPTGFKLFDINYDGQLDIFWCGHGGVFWKMGLEGFEFTTELFHLGPETQNKAVFNFCFADLDQDLDADLISLGRKVSNFPQAMRWYENEFDYTVVTSDAYIKDELNAIILSPNPTSNHINISLAPSKNQQLEIHSINGYLVYKDTFTSSSIDLSDIDAGIYLLRITEDSGSVIVEETFIKGIN